MTVLTPCLNGADFLADALRSVERQADADVEHIVLDGGSRDASASIAGQFQHARLIVRPDDGSHDAMNKGVDEAAGEIICFVNSDDILLDGAIAQARAVFARRPDVTMAHGMAGFYRRNDTGNFVFDRAIRLPVGDRLLEDVLFGVPCLNAWFFRRSLFARRKFDNSFAISADRMFLATAAAEEVIAPIEAPVYAYRIHDGSSTMASRPDATLAIAREHLRLADEFRRQYPPGDRRHDLAPRLAAFEHARIANTNARAGRPWAAAAALGSAVATSPFWPLHLVRALSARRRFYRDAQASGTGFPDVLAGFMPGHSAPAREIETPPPPDHRRQTLR